MFCKKCGRNLKNDTMFCPYCGEKQCEDKKDVITAEAPKKIKKERKKMSAGKKAAISIIAVLVVLIITVAAIGIAYYMSNEQKIARALKNEDYQTALQIYNYNFYEGPSVFLERTIQDRLEKVKEDYVSGSLEYEVVKMEIATIEKMEILSLSSAVSSTKDYVFNLNTSRTAFSTAESMFANNDFVGAIENYKKVISDDSNYETAKTKLSSAVEQYRMCVITKASDYKLNGLISSAITELEVALKILPDDDEISRQLNIYKREYIEQIKAEALKNAADHANRNDYINAINTIKVSLETNKNDAALLAALEKYSSSFVSSIIAEVDKLISQKEYDGAISVLNGALDNLPENKILKEKLNAVKEDCPVSISELTPINGGWNWNEGIPIDPFSVTHSNVCNFAILSGGTRYYVGNHYSEYRLYGKYTNFSGSLVSHSDISETGNSYIQIYADDKLVYTSPQIKRKTDVVDFSVNISGADYVKIVVVADKGDVSGWLDAPLKCLILMDCRLWPI